MLFYDNRLNIIYRGIHSYTVLFYSFCTIDNITSIYTSGRKCNFQGKGCDAAHFQPINVNGWFWTGAGNARLPPTNVDNKNTFWSKTGQ